MVVRLYHGGTETRSLPEKRSASTPAAQREQRQGHQSADPGHRCDRGAAVDRRAAAAIVRRSAGNALIGACVAGHVDARIIAAGVLAGILEGTGSTGREWRWCLLEMGTNQLGHGIPLKRSRTTRQLPGHAAQGVEVGPGSNVARLARELFRSHVGRRPAHLEILAGRAGSGLERPGDSKIGDLQTRSKVIRTSDEAVGGLDVEMNHVPDMGMREPIEDAEQDRPELLPGEPAGERLQCAPAGILQDQIGEPASERPRDVQRASSGTMP
jgi:hypothetical protein